MGVWLFMILVVVLGTVLSTYLNAPISLMMTILIIILGQPAILKYIDEQSQPYDPVNRPGGRAAEALYRLVNKENMVSVLQDTSATRMVVRLDDYSRFMVKFVHASLPDVVIYDRKNVVAEGFDIPMGEMAAAFLRLLMYCFPLLLLGYYLLSGREIAN